MFRIQSWVWGSWTNSNLEFLEFNFKNSKNSKFFQAPNLEFLEFLEFKAGFGEVELILI